jgi:hypothetical protein
MTDNRFPFGVSDADVARATKLFRAIDDALDEIFGDDPDTMVLPVLTTCLAERVVSCASSKRHAQRYADIFEGVLGRVWDRLNNHESTS